MVGTLLKGTRKGLRNAPAHFGGESAFVAGIVVGGEGEEVRGICLEAGQDVAGYFSDHGW